MNQQQNTIHCLFARCAGCGDKLEEGAVFELGLPMCVGCYAGDRCKLRTVYVPKQPEEKKV